MALSAVLVVAVACGERSPVAGATCKGSLDLEALSQQEIPKEMQIVGLDRARDGGIVYWTRAGELFVLEPGMRPPGRAVTGENALVP